MVKFGLDCLLENFPSALKGKRIGIICHAASIDSSYNHIIERLAAHPDARLSAIFGPQHGLHGQTQDNMVEWEGNLHPQLQIPVYSLYGQVRKPTPKMLEGLDAIVFDVQDVGARPYTYVWTLKLCMEACVEKGIAVWVLDRPNPIGCAPIDGPMLSSEFFSFVGGAEIPLCHRLTMGELALLLKKQYFGNLDLNVVWAEGWWRNSLWSETGLPWVLPSPNMPTLDTAVVYPGQVLIEATNMSEGRGTTRPFELFGAPYIRINELKKQLASCKLPGCLFREHGFIPTFQKWQGQYCNGMQIHVTDARKYLPVTVSAAIFKSVLDTSEGFKFKDPPYEYEAVKMPFDILAGDTSLRTSLIDNADVWEIRRQWEESYTTYLERFPSITHYPEERS